MPPKGAKTPRKAANGYKLPDPLPEGLVFSSIKNSWRLGKSIGVGGFGEIYLCGEDLKRAVGEDAPLAVKIEPHENGPLFVEMNFYMRAAMPEAVEEFKRARKIPNLGMPVLRGHGSHMHKGEKYRFLVMDRFGNDLQKIFQNGKKLFSGRTAFNLAMKIIDVLEYIHSKGYVHNDIKAQNLLLGYGRSKENDVYLVDFGLVCKYQRDGVHLEYKPDARKAHDGTIEYTSRDAHIGAHGRRSDLEILGYNLVHWMSGNLPWMDNLTNAQSVHAQKKNYMNDIPSFLQHCFGENEYPGELEEFLKYVAALEFDTIPDYDNCRDIFKAGLRKRKYPADGKIDFSAQKSPPKKVRKGRNVKKHLREVSKNGLVRPTPATSPVLSELLSESGAVTRSVENEEMDGWCWESVLCSDPEMLIRQASRQSENEDDNPLAIQHRQLEAKKQVESLQNPTSAMIEIMRKMEERERERQQMTWHQQLQHLTGRKAPRTNTWDLTPNPLTPAMEEVIKMRSKRISFDYDIPITPDPSDSENSESDSDSSHEEYVPSSSKKQPLVKEPNRLPSKRMSPARKSLLEDDVADEGGITFEDDDDEFENVMLNESILKFLREDGVTLQQQQQELRRYNKSKVKKPAQTLFTASTSTSDWLRPTECDLWNRGRPLELQAVTTMDESGPSSSMDKIKGRRISIQNDVSPIRNKDSPPDQMVNGNQSRIAKKSSTAKGKGAAEKWIVNGHIKASPNKQKPVVTDTPIVTPAPHIDEIKCPLKNGRRKRPAASPQRKPEAKSRKLSQRESNGKSKARLTRAGSKRTSPELEDISTKRRRNSSINYEDIPASTSSGKRAVQSSSISAAMVHVAKMKIQRSQHERRRPQQQLKTRRVRSRCDAQSWNWGEVLLSNPELILRKK